MSSTLFIALALVLVIEGIFPFVAPELWRQTFQRITQMPQNQIRLMGLSSMLLGLLVLYLLH